MKRRTLVKDDKELLAIGLDYEVEEIAKYITPDEYASMMSVVDNPEHRLIMRIMWETGARVNEILNLRVSDIDKNGIVFRGKKTKRIKKTEKKLRVVPIQRGLRDMLQMYIKTLGLRRDDKLFKLSYSGAYAMVRRYGEKAGINKIVHPHLFRHGFAINFLKQRRNLPILQKILGHRFINTTMIYLRFVQPDVETEINEMMFW